MSTEKSTSYERLCACCGKQALPTGQFCLLCEKKLFALTQVEPIVRGMLRPSARIEIRIELESSGKDEIPE